jgi:nucleoside-diphosphate-sugar epimerase
VIVLLTGSSGRVGRAIYGALAGSHDVVGLDRNPFSTTRVVGCVAEAEVLRRAMGGADAVVHTAALHAPHVGVETDEAFYRTNIEALRDLIRACRDAGVRTLVYTSTTALYGAAVEPGRCTWVDESTLPVPVSVYHRTKLEAESLLEDAAGPDLAVRVIRMSRCFPEPADRMTTYRLHRGIDVRDVADAHVLALGADGAAFQRYIASSRTPFLRSDIDALATDARAVIALRCPGLVEEFERRGWPLPKTIDRVYDSAALSEALGWHSRHGYAEVLAQLDRRSLEVLPFMPGFRDRTEE